MKEVNENETELKQIVTLLSFLTYTYVLFIDIGHLIRKQNLKMRHLRGCSYRDIGLWDNGIMEVNIK